jgi:very-short-patch-repair endonuclease
MIIVLAGLPRPESNLAVYRDGEFVARPDLSYPEHKLAIEYDGAAHADAQRRSADERRRVELRALGWRVLTFTSSEVLGAPEVVVARIAAELSSRVRREAS